MDQEQVRAPAGHDRTACIPPPVQPTGVVGRFVASQGYANPWRVEVGDRWVCPEGHRWRLRTDGTWRRVWSPWARVGILPGIEHSEAA